MVNVDGKIKGSRWFVCGNLGLVQVNGSRLGTNRSVGVSIDMTKLSDWVFPTEGDPREPSNLSMWRDGRDIVKEIREGEVVTTDPSTIASHPLFSQDPGFAMRLCAIPTKGGNFSLWLCYAPLNRDDLKNECEMRGLDLTSPYIPTFGIKMPAKGSQSKKKLWEPTCHKRKAQGRQARGQTQERMIWEQDGESTPSSRNWIWASIRSLTTSIRRWWCELV